MDGTEGLDDGPYRVYHVVCQLIYLHEGPIALNEQGLAGRCKQSTRAFRSNLKVLLDLGKLALNDGRLSNVRADSELEIVRENRENAAKGGRTPRQRSTKQRERSAKSSELASNSLANKNQEQATLQNDESLKEKRRGDETREEKNVAPSGATAAAPPPSKSEFIPDDHALGDRIMLAQRLDKHDPRVIGTSYFAKKWREAGWDAEVIVNTIERLMAKRTEPPGSLKYFEKAIADAHAELARPVPQGTTGPPRRARTKSAAERFLELDDQLNGQTDAAEPARPDYSAGPGIILDA